MGDHSAFLTSVDPPVDLPAESLAQVSPATRRVEICPACFLVNPVASLSCLTTASDILAWSLATQAASSASQASGAKRWPRVLGLVDGGRTGRRRDVNRVVRRFRSSVGSSGSTSSVAGKRASAGPCRSVRPRSRSRPGRRERRRTARDVPGEVRGMLLECWGRRREKGEGRGKGDERNGGDERDGRRERDGKQVRLRAGSAWVGLDVFGREVLSSTAPSDRVTGPRTHVQSRPQLCSCQRRTDAWAHPHPEHSGPGQRVRMRRA